MSSMHTPNTSLRRPSPSAPATGSRTSLCTDSPESRKRWRRHIRLSPRDGVSADFFRTRRWGPQPVLPARRRFQRGLLFLALAAVSVPLAALRGVRVSLRLFAAHQREARLSVGILCGFLAGIGIAVGSPFGLLGSAVGATAGVACAFLVLSAPYTIPGMFLASLQAAHECFETADRRVAPRIR